MLRRIVDGIPPLWMVHQSSCKVVVEIYFLHQNLDYFLYLCLNKPIFTLGSQVYAAHYAFTSCLPLFSPEKRARKALGVFSKPLIIVS